MNNIKPCYTPQKYNKKPVLAVVDVGMGNVSTCRFNCRLELAVVGTRGNIVALCMPHRPANDHVTCQHDRAYDPAHGPPTTMSHTITQPSADSHQVLSLLHLHMLSLKNDNFRSCHSSSLIINFWMTPIDHVDQYFAWQTCWNATV